MLANAYERAVKHVMDGGAVPGGDGCTACTQARTARGAQPRRRPQRHGAGRGGSGFRRHAWSRLKCAYQRQLLLLFCLGIHGESTAAEALELMGNAALESARRAR